MAQLRGTTNTLGVPAERIFGNVWGNTRGNSATWQAPLRRVNERCCDEDAEWRLPTQELDIQSRGKSNAADARFIWEQAGSLRAQKRQKKVASQSTRTQQGQTLLRNAPNCGNIRVQSLAYVCPCALYRASDNARAALRSRSDSFLASNSKLVTD